MAGTTDIYLIPNRLYTFQIYFFELNLQLSKLLQIMLFLVVRQVNF